jgi:5-methyltetrahydropteroyltriglutamate--homocysteine methyltransferase
MVTGGHATVRKSNDRIITTHCGSLPRPEELIALLAARDSGDELDAQALEKRISDSVTEVVRRQVETGIDVVNDGEHSKSSFTSYTGARLGGLAPMEQLAAARRPSRDELEFSAVYEEQRAMYAARPSNIRRRRVRESLACTGPITYTGQDLVRTDIENLLRAMRRAGAQDGFMSALSPTNVAPHFRNDFYRTEEEYLFAIADAMRVEYKAIVDAGLILQIDDPRFATHFDRSPGASIEECRRFMGLCVEVVNRSLQGIPEDRVRFHTCYSTNVAPRAHDMELKHFVDLMLDIRAGGYSFEAANPRHEHEWQVWEEIRLPEDKVLLPGVVSHCVALVEHPELVAQRIARFAGVVGKHRVIASNDCGFATAAAGDEVHPDVAWAKMRSLVDGARLASEQLWGQ